MKNITNKTKTILFAGLLVAMILPFSVMSMAEAAPNENATKDDSKKNKYDKKTNFEKKDHRNYKADKILEKMGLLIQKMPSNSTDGKIVSQKYKMEALQKELEKVTKEHKDKIIDKELRKDLKKARQLIIDSGIPTNALATGIDHLYIQLSKENAEYEEQIIEILNGLPYLLEYGEGFKRTACLTTSSDCVHEVGGLKIQIKSSPLPFTEISCSLSIPMKKDGVDGFLTAAHCFSGYSETVYQPDISSESYILGHSNSTWRSFEDDGECDCAWIKDTSSNSQIAGVYAYPNHYWAIYSTHIPSVGEYAKLRGFHSNNGEYNWSTAIEYNDISISDWWGLGKTTVNMMAFASPVQGGDSGGSVFYGSKYIGIVVGQATIDNKSYAVFVPWDHITENISGLELTPHT